MLVNYVSRFTCYATSMMAGIENKRQLKEKLVTYYEQLFEASIIREKSFAFQLMTSDGY